VEPMMVVKLEKGVEAIYGDGHRAALTLDGSRCTCNRASGVPCVHIRNTVGAYSVRKWDVIEANPQQWGRNRLREMGIDPDIFYPPAVTEADFEGASFGFFDNVMNGRLFVFPDGAFFWVGREHRTRCSRCQAVECWHYVEARSEIAAVVAAIEAVA